MNKPGVRFTVSRHNSYDDIREVVACLGELAGGRPLDLGGRGWRARHRAGARFL